jgi:anti-anti-sigma factor
MKVHWALDGKVAILRPKGDLHDDPEIDAFVTPAKDLAAKGNRALLIDMGDVQLISSIGLGGFVRIAKAYREREGEVVLCNLTKRNHTLFEIVKLTFLFNVHESEREALDALRAWLAKHATV